MPVKDLVGLYESRTNLSPSSTGSSSHTPGQADRTPTNSNPTVPRRYDTLDAPISSPARFISHPLLRRREPSTTDQEDEHLLADGRSEETHSSTVVEDARPSFDERSPYRAVDVADADVTDELLAASGRQLTFSDFSAATSKPSISGWLKTSGLPDRDTPHEIELDTLLPLPTDGSAKSVLHDHDSRSFGKGHVSSIASSVTAFQNPKASSSTVTLVAPPRRSGSHTPVPLSQVVSRDAAPLALPRLDDYISSLNPPSFPSHGHRRRRAGGKKTRKGKGKATNSDPDIFPPMDQLEGQKLADLENNSKIAPSWRNRDTILSMLTNITLGVTGSSALASFYSVQGLIDTLQIFALILSTIGSHGSEHVTPLRKLFVQTIPNVLALNFASSIVQSLILLTIFMTISAILLVFFYRMTSVCCSTVVPEGLQPTRFLKNTWPVVLVSFLLTVIYLPLSTMAVHVLVWSEDLWVVPNPYQNATTFPPPPLGPPEAFHDPLDFCWTTTMARNEINWAPVVIVLAIISVFGLTFWFPLHLHTTIRYVTPKVDRYTELGALRSSSDMDREYERLLDRDPNPLSFLYSGYRRGWATYQSTYLFAKLTTLLLTAVVDPDNCLFRSLTREKVQVARQVLLVIAMLVFFILQCVFAPFQDPVNNASEWTSRLNYLLTSAVSLAVAFNIPGSSILDGVVLYIIYTLTYGLSFYFTIINMHRTRQLMKKLARRIDFSIDIFSPRVDISSSSPHAKRRIWQEAISTLLLTDPECRMPEKQRVEYKQAREGQYPPYLLNFAGSPAERHVENLKILREVGWINYNKAIALMTGPDYEWFRHLEDNIQRHFVGPDCYWKPPGMRPKNCTKFFGNAWWIPFPPTLVINYDDGPQAVLTEVRELELYARQNASEEVQRKRQIRMALRALDGQIVRWPFNHIESVGDEKTFGCCGRRYGAEKHTHYYFGLFNIHRCGKIDWEGLDIGSGFDIRIKYAKDVIVNGTVTGLTDDYELTKPLARFLAMNEHLIPPGLSRIEAALHSYRSHYRKEFEWKKETMSYRFLSAVYNQPREPSGLSKSAIEIEQDPRVKRLMSSCVDAIDITYERLSAVTTSELATWWYIFWDDLWRRNWDSITALETYEPDFNPHFPTSIAYTPLPRAALENFLAQRGLLHIKPKWGDFFHAGFLNMIYLRMNDIVFQGLHEAIIFHMGDDHSELDMEEIDAQTVARPSTLGTGGGTDHDDASIRARPVYRWEGLIQDPLRHRKRRHRPFLAKLAVWMGLSPFWRTDAPSLGLSIDVKLENGKYVLLESRSDYGGSLVKSTPSKIV